MSGWAKALKWLVIVVVALVVLYGATSSFVRLVFDAMPSNQGMGTAGMQALLTLG